MSSEKPTRPPDQQSGPHTDRLGGQDRAPVIRVVDCTLVVIEGPDAGKVFPIPDVVTAVGSSAACDVRLSDSSISRHHFTLREEAKGHLIRDEGSTNGTLLNGTPIREAFLKPGMMIRLGQTTLEFREKNQSIPVEPYPHPEFHGLLGQGPGMRQLFGYLERLSATRLTVMLLGETGAGKEVIAAALHQASPRAGKPYVVFDCASIEPNLVGSALFGHARGAFTGAQESRRGAFQQADGGSLFIDEVGELPLDVQPRLLRALERREVQPLGSDQIVKVDVRIITATHRDLQFMVSRGEFRKDLYYRLAGMVLRVPPLRERSEDIPVLAARFLDELRPGATLSPEAIRVLTAHSWAGNVRELRNVIERAATFAVDSTIGREHVIFDTDPRPGPTRPASGAVEEGSSTLIDLEKRALIEALESSGGNRVHAARQLGITPKTLREKLYRFGLATPPGRPGSRKSPV